MVQEADKYKAEDDQQREKIAAKNSLDLRLQHEEQCGRWEPERKDQWGRQEESYWEM